MQESSLNIYKYPDAIISFIFLPSTTHNYLAVTVKSGKVEPNTYVCLIKRVKALIRIIIIKLSVHYERGTVLSNLHVLVQSIFTTTLS